MKEVKFKEGDKVKVVTLNKHFEEQENWAIEANLHIDETYIVSEVGDAGWLELVGVLYNQHPSHFEKI
jgi:hypothetical protein